MAMTRAVGDSTFPIVRKAGAISESGVVMIIIATDGFRDAVRTEEAVGRMQVALRTSDPARAVVCDLGNLVAVRSPQGVLYQY